MKAITLLVIFLLMSCKPYSLDKDRSPRVKDDAEGAPRFELPDIDEIGLDEIRENKDKCKDYNNHTIHNPLLGKNAYLNQAVNCIAYNIDKGLEPLCDLEKEVRSELNSADDDVYAEELEAYLEEIELEKEIFVDHLYEFSDPIYDLCGEIEDEVDEIKDKTKGGVAKAFISIAGHVLIDSECGRLYRVIDSKARLACTGVDFSDFYERKSR